MTLILAVLEGSSILAAALGALVLWAPPATGGWRDLLAVLPGAGALMVSCVLAFSYAGLYDLRVVRSFDAFLGRVPRALAAAIILAALASAAVPAARIADNAFMSSVLLPIAVVFGPTLVLRAGAYWLMQTRRFVRRLLIVGNSLLAWQLIEEIHDRPDRRYAVAGVAGDGTDADAAALQDFPGGLAGLDAVIDRVQPDEIVVAPSDRRGRLPIRELLDARVHRGIPVHDGVALFERLAGKLPIEALAYSHLIFSNGFHQSRLALRVRRGVSILAAVLGLIATAPLLGLIALAVTLDSPGPVLFAQRRVGFRGKPFTLLKFRTMHPVVKPPSEWERDNGHRITRVGRWLRRFWLDELPQLVNILRGDMDLVGPRPHPVCNAELFTQKIPYYTLRTSVRPGLTGWAQVRYGYANDLEEEAEKMCYDLYYIKHRSLWLDLRILLETLKTALGGHRLEAAHLAPHPLVAPSRPAWYPGDGSGIGDGFMGEPELQLTRDPGWH